VTLPGTPIIGTATLGNAQAFVNFTPPTSNGGSFITGYTVTSNPENIIVNGLSSPITVSGLKNGTTYTFTVTATNAIGTGPASAPSNAVTPQVEWYGSDTPAGRTVWDTGVSTCAGLSTVGGAKPGVSWRLPSQAEMLDKWNSISRPARSTPTPGFQNATYWSGDTYSGNSGYAWAVDMGAQNVCEYTCNYWGGINGQMSKTMTNYIRCVR
jgi:hypothetical protein